MEKIAKTRRAKWVCIWVVPVSTAVSGLIYGGVFPFYRRSLARSHEPPSRDRSSKGPPRRPGLVDTYGRRNHAAGLVSCRRPTAALDRAGARHVELLAGDGCAGADLHRRGFDVLLFDLRGHGQSDPSRLYLGRRERAISGR